MKRKWIFTGLVVFIAAAGLIFAYLATSKERAKEAEGEKPVSSESQVKPDANGEVTVHLEPETQKRLAMKVAMLEAIQFRPEIKGYGRVLDPTPLAALAAELSADRAAAAASRQEFERLKTLAAQNNASAQALQSGEASALRDQIQVETIYQRMLVAWGKTIAERNELADFIQSLAVQQSALIRVDLLAGDILKTPPQRARLFAALDENNPVEAQLISLAPAIDPQSQGQGLFFLVATNQSRLLPGASVTAYLPDSDEPITGVEIPREAVVRFNGQACVYLQTNEEVFTRHEIGLEHPTTSGWFVSEGMKPGARVVVSGAQMLLSEEKKSQIQTGD